MGIKILNVKLNPELANIDLGTIGLKYSYHALRRCTEKHIRPVYQVTAEAGSVVEIERDTYLNKTVKIIVRIKYSNNYDLVLVLVPKRDYYVDGSLFVKTCWLNHKTDNHSTLNLSRLSA